MKRGADAGLEFLLAFDGRVHRLESGYRIEFRIRRIEPERRRPHGLVYSLTLHGPGGARIVGFDNAHRATGAGIANDHWHRNDVDTGRPYRFVDAETLLEDFFAAVEKALRERGVGTTVVGEEERRRRG